MEFCNCSMFCCALLCVHSTLAIILMGKIDLVALLFVFLGSRDNCFALPHGATTVCMQFVIVVFLDHSH